MNLSEHITINRQLAECVCQRLTEEINELGFTETDIKHYPRYDDADFELIKDPYTGEHNLTCHWYDEPLAVAVNELFVPAQATAFAGCAVIEAVLLTVKMAFALTGTAVQLLLITTW